MPHGHGECFGDDHLMLINNDPCINCAWYRIRALGSNELAVVLSDDYQKSLRLVRLWLAKVPNRGELSLRRLYDMLRGLRFQHLKIQSKGKQYYTRLTHEAGMLYDGYADNVSDSIGAALASYVNELVEPNQLRI